MTPNESFGIIVGMTSKQLELLRFIRNKIVHTGSGPTFREMRDFMEVTSNQTVADVLNALEREGYIDIVQGKQRGIELTDKVEDIDKGQQIHQPVQLPQSSAVFPSNASSTFTIPSSNATGINFQSNGIVPWQKGGEKNGTT